MTGLKTEGMTRNHSAEAATKAFAEVPGVDTVIAVGLEQADALGRQ